jgi:hypothetical protein|tara:strand:+ start:1361 stop:1564 length:204 start_codon:yes stop_codon:yes gene_type:complete
MNKSPYFNSESDSPLIDLVCASKEEEFFYNDSDTVVAEGDPVGVDIENGSKVDLVLFKNVYWSPPNE